MSITQTVKNAIDLANTLANPEQKIELLGLLLRAREEALALQEENRQLKEQIESYNRFDKNMENYRLVHIDKCAVYQHKTDFHVFVCPHCVEFQKFHLLNPTSMIGDSHICPSCKNSFRLHGDPANSTPIS